MIGSTAQEILPGPPSLFFCTFSLTGIGNFSNSHFNRWYKSHPDFFMLSRVHTRGQTPKEKDFRVNASIIIAPYQWYKTGVTHVCILTLTSFIIEPLALVWIALNRSSLFKKKVINTIDLTNPLIDTNTGNNIYLILSRSWKKIYVHSPFRSECWMIDSRSINKIFFIIKISLHAVKREYRLYC